MISPVDLVGTYEVKREVGSVLALHKGKLLPVLTYHGLDLLPVFEVDAPAGDQSNLLFVAPTICSGRST
jgi:hypothetical protein